MQRKETYGTSGVRIKLRMFGGWDFKPDVFKQKDWVTVGYARGVPMGGDLPRPKAKAPSFIVQALKDPDDGNLDRIQIVKGWTRSGQTFEKIYDVAWSGNRKLEPTTGRVAAELAVGDTVNVENASYTNTIGAVELKTVWTDPIRSRHPRLLLRPGVADSDATLDNLRRQGTGYSAASRRARDRAGARMVLAYLVHADRRGGEERKGGWPGGVRPETEGCGRARRRSLKELIVGKSLAPCVTS